MAEPADNVRIVVSVSNFACIENALAKGSPARKAVELASRNGRDADTVVITCSESVAEELHRIAQVSCRGAMENVKAALDMARRPNSTV